MGYLGGADAPDQAGSQMDLQNHPPDYGPGTQTGPSGLLSLTKVPLCLSPQMRGIRSLQGGSQS